MKRKAEPIDLHVGARIKLRRRALRISQEKLAQGLDITFQQVQKYENGSSRVSASRLHKIASILQVQVGYFFADDSAPVELPPLAPQHEDAIMNFVMSEEGIELNTAFSNLLDVSTRQSFVRFVASLASTALGKGEERERAQRE